MNDSILKPAPGAELSGRRLVIVSNRLPFNVAVEDGLVVFHPSAGGLVTGLASFRESGKQTAALPAEHLWVGWPGSVDPALHQEVAREALARFQSYPVFLTEEQMEQFYLGFCNSTIWPLFHYFPSYAVYQQPLWEQYKSINQLFADALDSLLRADDVVWAADGLPASLPASPVLEVEGDTLTLTYTEGPPTAVGGVPLSNVVDVVRVAASYEDAGQARYQIAVDNAAGQVVLFDTRDGFPVTIEADTSSWLMQGLNGAPAGPGTTIEVDLDAVFEAFGFSPTDEGTALGVARFGSSAMDVRYAAIAASDSPLRFIASPSTA